MQLAKGVVQSITPTTDMAVQNKDPDPVCVASGTEPTTELEWREQSIELHRGDVLTLQSGQTYFFICEIGDAIVGEMDA